MSRETGRPLLANWLDDIEPPKKSLLEKFKENKNMIFASTCAVLAVVTGSVSQIAGYEEFERLLAPHQDAWIYGGLAACAAFIGGFYFASRALRPRR